MLWFFSPLQPWSNLISFPHLVCWDSAPALRGNGRQCIGGGARVEARARRGPSGSTTMSHKSSDLLLQGYPCWSQMGVRAGIGTSGCIFPRGERDFSGMKASEFRYRNLGIDLFHSLPVPEFWKWNFPFLFLLTPDISLRSSFILLHWTRNKISINGRLTS